MKPSQIFILLTIVIGGAFLGIMSVFDLPQSVAGWVISDIVLAVYLGYLLFTFVRGSSNISVEHFSKKVTA
ncbi:MAG: C4-dicarboxylate ABC transporter [Saprospiraceae bacterium]|nr:C4-dicarboxylate ABC transporter [Candidatus Brachybacter algidus]